MIEYYLKYNTKNLKSTLSKFIIELETLLALEQLSIEKSDQRFYESIKPYLSESDYEKWCDLWFTLSKWQSEYPFFRKYFKPQTGVASSHRFVDLFAGCGGLSLGIEQAGFECVLVNEIDAVFGETHYFNHHLPLSRYFIGDIQELVQCLTIEKENWSLENVDLVCGGPPCQGFSMANRQRILDDPRNHLYKAYLQFLSITRPKFFIMENVKGMANRMDEILANFHQYLGDDYDMAYAVLNAKHFGIPQHRERLFLIGNRMGVNSEQIFTDLKASQIETGYSLKDALSKLPALAPKRLKNDNSLENTAYGFTMTRQTVENNVFLNDLNGNRCVSYVFNHKNRFNNDRDIEIFDRLPQGANSLHASIADIMPYGSRNHMFKDKYFKLEKNKVCKTITSHMKFDCNMYIHPTQARGLSAREAARVQTFPDDFFLRGSQNNWYAQVGNAVPVQLAKLLGKQVKKYL
ncbi:MAG: hypothetical protein RL757_1560 [Bacteroidota bacterium]|jgi:DNA (cytosine-5)-methyltransferase 1